MKSEIYNTGYFGDSQLWRQVEDFNEITGESTWSVWSDCYGEILPARDYPYLDDQCWQALDIATDTAEQLDQLQITTED